MSRNQLDNMFSLLPPYPIYDNSRVVVISDSQYREYIQKQAREEITALKSRRERYQTLVNELDVEIERAQQRAELPSTTLSGGSNEGVQHQE